VGCNCGGNFQIDDGLVEDSGPPPVPGDASYFWNGADSGAEDEGSLIAPNGTPVWNPDTGLTERGA
jgi:hypothetical protein